jgi:hypothetical protein
LATLGFLLMNEPRAATLISTVGVALIGLWINWRRGS